MPGTSRRDFIKGSVLGTIGIVSAYSSSHGSISRTMKKPNVIFIMTDDQGYQDIGVYGAPDIKTPNLDQMAEEGVRFTDFYSMSPTCSPARTALLTGCYPQRVGIPRVLFPQDEIGLSSNEYTLGNLFQDAGYKTACFGKWHLGHKPPFLPTQHGFDYYFGIPYSNDMWIDPALPLSDEIMLREGWSREQILAETHDQPSRDKVPLMRNNEVVEHPAEQSTLTKRYTEEAISFIEKNQGEPFFIYLPHTMPHIPLEVSEKFKGVSEAGLYGDVIEELDWSVGQILKALKRLNLDEDTLVIYTSDNGPWLHPEIFRGSSHPLRDSKFSTYEGGVRVPCIARWPETIPPGIVCNEVAGFIDILPTFAALIDADLPGDRIIDGKDITSLLLGTPDAKSPHEAIFYYRANELEAVRSGVWKLRQAGDDPVELYNLENDISETSNLAEAYPDLVNQLHDMMKSFDAELKANSRPHGVFSPGDT